MQLAVVFSLIFMALTPFGAIADEIHCDSLISLALSYHLVISDGRATASLLILQEGNPDHREFDCVRIPRPTTPNPDSMPTTHSCKERNAKAKPLSLIMGEGGFIYHREVKIREEAEVGGRLVFRVFEQGH